MAITPEEFLRHRKRRDELQRDKDQAIGSLKEQEKRLKEEFDLTPKEVESALKKLRAKADKVEAEFRAEEARIEKDYNDRAN